MDTHTSFSDLSSPYAYTGMQKAIERIRQAIIQKERVGIFGDYDCDGVTAALILTRFFQRKGLEPVVILPHRIRDGYGLNASIVQQFKEQNVSVLITVDTGIGSTKEIEQAKQIGIDTIVTDHHYVPKELPDAIAIVHPALSHLDEPHPSGAGTVLQLVRGLEEIEWKDSNTDIALAMIGTVADLVELKGENRLLTVLGLKALNQLHTGPLADLAMQVRYGNAPLTSGDIAFRIAPRINAAGRMADAMLAFEALLHGGAALEQIDALNVQRKQDTSDLYAALLHVVPTDTPLLASASKEYPHGIIGLLAGKLTEQFGRPSIVAAIDGNICTASLRSTPMYHITEGLKRYESLLIHYGGHAQAAGCTFYKKNWNALTTSLQQDIDAQVAPGRFSTNTPD